MTLQTSGKITVSNVQTEFGGTNPISLSEYNRGGGLVASHGVNMAISTTDSNISLSDFYGSSKNFKVTITSGTMMVSDTVTDSGYRNYSVGSNGSFGSVSGNLQIGFSKSNNAANAILTGFWERATYRPKEGGYLYDLYFKVDSKANCATQSWYSVTCGGQEVLRTTFTTVGNNSWTIINDASSFNVNGDFVFRIASGD